MYSNVFSVKVISCKFVLLKLSFSVLNNLVYFSLVTKSGLFVSIKVNDFVTL